MLAFLSILTSIALFIGVLVLLILVHEWGHYIAAKLTGMRVDEFGVGFPPKLASTQRGETEYSLNALPIGGFVRIYGEDPTTLAETDPDYSRAFGNRPKWAQAIVLVAGVTMNALLAWALLTVVLMMGTPTQVSEAEAGPSANLVVFDVLADSPAAAVIPPGATIVGLTAEERTLENLTPTALTEFVSQVGEEPVTIDIIAPGDVARTVEITPQTGVITEDPDRAVIGVSLGLTEVVSLPFHEAVPAGFTRSVELTQAIVQGVGSLILGQADWSQVAGPIGIVGYVGDAAAVGFAALLIFTAVISLNLAVINLLPIPALDGGRLVFVAIEAITRRPIAPEWTARLNTAGFIFLILIMIAVSINDVLRLW